MYQFEESNGGAVIDYFSVEVDDGTGFVEVGQVTTSPASLSHEKITSGLGLTFRYRAHNVHGYSGYSPTSVIDVATVSTVPLNTASVHTPLDSRISFQWNLPANTGGLGVQIDGYRIMI